MLAASSSRSLLKCIHLHNDSLTTDRAHIHTRRVRISTYASHIHGSYAEQWSTKNVWRRQCCHEPCAEAAQSQMLSCCKAEELKHLRVNVWWLFQLRSLRLRRWILWWYITMLCFFTQQDYSLAVDTQNLLNWNIYYCFMLCRASQAEMGLNSRGDSWCRSTWNHITVRYDLELWQEESSDYLNFWN